MFDSVPVREKQEPEPTNNKFSGAVPPIFVVVLYIVIAVEAAALCYYMARVFSLSP